MAFYLIWTSQTLNSKIRYGSSKKVQNGAENWQNCLIARGGGNGKISKSFHLLQRVQDQKFLKEIGITQKVCKHFWPLVGKAKMRLKSKQFYNFLVNKQLKM